MIIPEEMTAQAEKRFKEAGAEVLGCQMDAQKLEFADENFDAVVSRNVLWNLDDPAAPTGKCTGFCVRAES